MTTTLSVTQDNFYQQQNAGFNSCSKLDPYKELGQINIIRVYTQNIEGMIQKNPQQKTMLIYRGKRRNHPKNQAHQDQKSQNLRNVHRNLVQDANRQNYKLPSRVAKIEKPIVSHKSFRFSSRSNLQIFAQKEHQKSIDKEKNGQKPVNYYINIQKLKNLKISTRDKKINESFVSTNHLRRSSNLEAEKKSLILKKGDNRSQQKSVKSGSYDNLQKSLAERMASNRKSNLKPSKPKIRYRTHQSQEQQESSASILRSHANSQYMMPRKSNFKKANNEIKDKSFIDGYLRGKQLGRGGFSKVWEGFHFKRKHFYAIKEIDTTNKYQTHLTEIWFGNYFFEPCGIPKKEFMHHQGIQSLLKMYEYSIVDPRAFIVYENCDGSLGNMLYDIYEEDRDDEEIEEDEKLYMIKYKSLYGQLKKSGSFVRQFLVEISRALDLLSDSRIVHSDIKTENILLKKSENGKRYQFKLIDYGSSFMFESLKQYKLATPEYMCPELLNYILFENKKSCHEYMLEYVKNYQNISAIDVWGLGCILLELIHGLPLWLNNRTKILVQGKYETRKGLFAVSDRSFSRILEKQLNIINNFDTFVLTENNSQIVLDKDVVEVLRCMLNPNPKFRIQPKQIIERLSKN